MIIDAIIHFNQRNSYFFVPLHDGWHFTKVNNQPPSVKAPFTLPFLELSRGNPYLDYCYLIATH